MKVKKLDDWVEGYKKPMIISGPCSIESKEQFFATVEGLKAAGINYIRGGIWKPRTRPGTFDGIGNRGLEWIKEAKDKYQVEIATEVATPQHVELALNAGIGLIWIGARTTVSPFIVQEIAESLKGVDIPVFIKNPINPDLSLWKGAIERFYKADITKLGAIHRGFDSFQKTKYRNVPLWQIPIELKSEFPELPLICDPSHIAGKRNMIQEISQKALDLNYDGLMIESHINPAEALSDAEQQLTPDALKKLLKQLEFRDATISDRAYTDHLGIIREQIDQADREILEAIATRMNLVEKIGEFKKENNVAIFQISRWKEIFKTRPKWAKALNLDADFIKELYRFIHQQSVKKQTGIYKTKDKTKKGL
jgi:chorismate mutase